MSNISKIKISHMQLASLLALSAVFTMSSSPHDLSMGRFISLLISTAIMFLLYIPLMIFSAKNPDGFITGNNKVLAWIFGVVISLRLLYTAYLATGQLELSITNTAMPYLSPLFFTLLVFAVVLYGAHKGVQASARIAPIALGLYIFLIASVSISVWDKVEFIRIYSPFSSSMNSIFENALYDVMRNDEIFFFAALFGFVRSKETESKPQAYKSILYYLSFILIAGLWLNFLCNAVLGRFINSVANPMYTVSSFSTFNIVERMDGLFITTAIIGGIVKITLCFVCIRAILSGLFSIKPRERSAKLTTSILLIAVAVLSMLLTGCSHYSPYVRLEQRIMVQLVGIDYSENNDKYTVSMQFSMGKTSDGGKSENDLATVTGEGANLYTAVKQARAAAGKEFFFTHNQVLILGQEVVENGAIRAIEEYLSYCDDHPNAYVAGVYGKAEEIISLTYKDEFSDKNKIMLLLENANNTGIAPAYMMYETLMHAYNTSGSCFIPMLEIQHQHGLEIPDTDNENAGEQNADESAGEPKVIPGGGVLITDNAPVTFMDSIQCAGLSFFTNTTNSSSIDFVYEEENITLELFDMKTKITGNFNSENLTFHVKFSAKCDKAHNPILRINSREKNAALKRFARDAIQVKMSSVADLTVNKGGDLLCLEDSLKHCDFKSWIKVEDKWSETLKNANFTYEIDIKLI